MMQLPSQTAFAEHLHSPFRIALETDRVIEVELTAVQDNGSSAAYERFSLIFLGPPNPFLPQGIYQMQHATLGPLALFLVPIGQEQRGFSYEAVFNLLRSREE